MWRNFLKIFSGLIVGLWLLPGNLYAAGVIELIDNPFGGGGGCAPLTFKCLSAKFISTILNPLVALLVGLAIVYFLFGLSRLLKGSFSTPKERSDAKNMMIMGVIAIFVMVSVWGLVKVVVDSFFSPYDLSSPPSIPRNY